ncbi:hypothetical protein [Actinomadura montaniterrae]|uniref:Uncharacterized protein n=1 Tax=Actinomadura montaniterrae TaxID=1803903 RepID=A0A6L3W4Z7_9ACTN|nr:hypothetical protein [Actinomadura montaniterrae]KAB2389936.1 hypothetical protein F9B16_01440 [Actinomadura montaniterrae]
MAEEIQTALSSRIRSAVLSSWLAALLIVATFLPWLSTTQTPKGLGDTLETSRSVDLWRLVEPAASNHVPGTARVAAALIACAVAVIVWVAAEGAAHRQTVVAACTTTAAAAVQGYLVHKVADNADLYSGHEDTDADSVVHHVHIAVGMWATLGLLIIAMLAFIGLYLGGER